MTKRVTEGQEELKIKKVHGEMRAKIVPTKWIWGIRCKTHKIPLEDKVQFDRLIIHLSRQLGVGNKTQIGEGMERLSLQPER